jgi:hypothetical protein
LSSSEKIEPVALFPLLTKESLHDVEHWKMNQNSVKTTQEPEQGNWCFGLWLWLWSE